MNVAPVHIAAHVETWEYAIVQWRFAPNGRMIVHQVNGLPEPADALTDLLAAYGAEGWELAGVGGSDGTLLFFKRRTEGSVRLHE